MCLKSLLKTGRIHEECPRWRSRPNASCGRSLATTKAESGPDQEWNAEILQKVILDLKVKAPPNTIQTVKNSPRNIRTSSTICSRVQFRRGFSLQRRTRGVTSIAPAPSPNHHVRQIEPYAAQSANPPKDRDVTPIVALIVVLSIPSRNANLKMSCALSKACGPRAKRRTR
jgi:hypothetical protein